MPMQYTQSDYELYFYLISALKGQIWEMMKYEKSFKSNCFQNCETEDDLLKQNTK